MASINRVFSDLNLAFNAHPITGDIGKVKGVDAIKRAVRHLILTNHYERPFQPALGSGITASLFENINIALQHQLESAVEDVIRIYEPRAKLQYVRIQTLPDDNRLVVTIVFEAVNITEPVIIDVFLERTR